MLVRRKGRPRKYLTMPGMVYVSQENVDLVGLTCNQSHADNRASRECWHLKVSIASYICVQRLSEYRKPALQAKILILNYANKNNLKQLLQALTDSICMVNHLIYAVAEDAVDSS